MEDERKTKKQLIEELNCLRLEKIDQPRVTSEKFTKAFLQNSIPITITTVKDGRFVEVSDAFLRLVGLKRDEVIGHTSRETGFITEEQRTLFYNELGKHGHVENFEMEVRPKGRGSRYGLFNVVMMTINNESYLLTTIQDITDRKQAGEALQNLNKTLSQVLNGLDALVYVVDMKTYEIVFINKYGQNIWGDINGKICWQTIQSGQSRPCEYCTNSKLIGHDGNPTEGVVWEFQNTVNKSWYECRDKAIYWPDGRIVRMEIATDITNRKQAGAALQQEQQFSKSIIDSLPNIFFLYSYPECKLVLWNKRHETDLGYTSDELKDRYVLDFHDPEYKELIMSSIKTVMEAGYGSADDVLVTKDGRKIPYFSTAVRFESKGKLYFMGICENITERKRAEEEKRDLQERLNRAEKMESLGLLAGGVAHDLNNVLGIVVGYAELLLDSVDEESPLRKDLKTIFDGGQKAAAIVEDLLTLARRGVVDRKIINLNKLIGDFKKSPQWSKLLNYHPHVQIKTELDPDLLNISASSIHLEKTLYNLISNASEAMTKGGSITIKTNNRYMDKPISGYDTIYEGDYVVLSVSDEGDGISEKDLKRIFEPFYTKKIMGRSGTGLGLSVVWGTVKDHQGYIDVQSEEGKGTTFTLYFLITREDTVNEDITVSMSEYLGNGQSLLIVDDVKDQRDLAARLLTSLNYKVSSVSSGEEAVTYLKDHQVDLIVLDMIMDPGMDGLDTYKSILAINPKQKAIIVSGFSESDRVKTAKTLGAGAYIKKPYIKEKLGLAVKKELARK